MKIVHPQTERELEFSILQEFICAGKIAGWASGRKVIKRGNVEKYTHFDKKHQLFYVDSFIGDQGFLGNEIVTWHNFPVWGMNYSGAFKPLSGLPAEELEDATSNFLKGMLRRVPTVMPFRGPLTQLTRDMHMPFSQDVPWGKLIYHHDVRFPVGQGTNGNQIRKFSGTEIVELALKGQETLTGSTCFELEYQGRILVPDSYVVE